MRQDSPKSPAETGGGEFIKPVSFEPARFARARPRLSFRPGAGLIAALLLVFGFAAWFLFAARAVFVETDPDGARIGIHSRLKFRLGDRFLLLPGSYGIDLAAAGYYPLRDVLPVGPDQNQHFSFRLKPLPGDLRLDSGPVAGAEVFVDDQPRGRTPSTVRELTPGEHRLRIEAERYFPFERTLQIEGLGKVQTLSAALVPAWAEVSVNSDPAGAEFSVDDQPAGATPLRTGILRGDHLLRLRLSGYKDWQQDVQLIAGQPLDLGDVRLEVADAVLSLISDPPGANTTLDGEYKGVTPLELALTPGRKSTVKLFKQGYRSVAREISAKSGETQRLSIPLQAELVTVQISVDPADALILVDGKAVGTGAQTLKLPSRTLRIDARKDGYADNGMTVTPDPNFTQQVRIMLQGREQARQAAMKPSVQSAHGQVLKLFRAGRFTMGASRREPGRRANENLQDVNLARPFYLGTKEISNAEFRKFDASHNSGQAQGESLDGEEHPVVMITWEQAALFCNWLSKDDSLTPFYRVEGQKVVGFTPSAGGYRLPTEAEWEWAARAVPGGPLLKFPWGADMPPSDKSGNYADESSSAIVGKVLYKYDDGFAATAPTGNFPANANGLYDMGGNAAEWVHDFYAIAAAASGAVLTDPQGPGSGEFHVIKGSSWMHGSITELRLSYRDYGNTARQDVGFRIARYAD